MAHVEQHVADLLVAIERAVDVAQIAADHHADELGLLHLAGDDRVHVAAVLEDGDLVGDLEDLAHAVRDVDDDLALGLELADDGEQRLDLRIAQAGGGLVKADDAQVFAAARLHDLHQLLIGDAQILDLVRSLDRDAELVDDLLRHLVGLVRVNDAEDIGGHAPQIDVFRDGELHEELPLLIDDAHARLDGLVRVAEMHLLAVDQVLPRGRLVVSIERLEQRRLAGTVLAQKGKHLAAVSDEAHVVQRLDTGKVLCDVAELQCIAQAITPPVYP